MVNWILTGYTPNEWEMLTADLNLDGALDVLDIVILVDMIMSG